MPATPALALTGHDLTLTDIVSVARARPGAPGPVLAPAATGRMTASVALKEDWLARGIPLYGITTGFGDSVAHQISADRAAALQRNLVTYHLNGTGPTAAPEVARAAQLIRANCLGRGPSAIRPAVVDTLLRHLAADLLPLIPERGSLGASGDLVPLCYLAHALLGEGEVLHRGRVRPAAEALAEEGIEPVVLTAKEGLALINGTAFTSAFAVLAAHDAAELAAAADIATALAVEALHGNASHFHPFPHRQKPHAGQLTSAATIRALLDGSELATDYQGILDRQERLGDRGFLTHEHRIQDPYSLRCAPHVTGVLRDTLDWVRPWLETEVNSSTDNPLFDTEEGLLHHGGNFYAGHVGQAMDSLKTAVANIADLLDRQLALVVDPRFSRGLPPNLTAPAADTDTHAGLHHGFKGMQIAASAITAEALKTAAPASLFSRSTEAHNQDKVSMGTIAARDARTVVELARDVTAIHLLAVAQAVELRGLPKASPTLQKVHGLIREHAPFTDRDRRMDGDIAAVAGLVLDGSLRRAAGLPEPFAAR
ncbi:aromatic amino acid ammonia-lyase [Streptomyces sp. CBMA156]|uniref:aromatic amino acid ammonia-lyase n=1 Tax=Streptomyces sp. CBMA156 TaxID=1930280 RepID=UPI0016620BFD|nr:aromatic amino acid ammonia-lyase [Streptomyces sp. CBMA156]MBD0676091.1 histidine ammonia-lyase [Streptomyces sp. CBMA156]